MDSVFNAQEYEKELTRIFNRFNNHFWNNELPEVIITFVPTKNAHGHLTSEPVWVSDKADSKYELNISAYTISRSPEKICATLLHEQCHLYNLINEIKDTSDYGRYHNKNFKIAAEDHGLIVKKDGRYGWAKTTLTEDTKNYVSRLNIKSFSFHRNYKRVGGNLMRFVCINCNGTTVFATKDQGVICGYCHERLVYMPTTKTSKESLGGLDVSSIFSDSNIS